MSVDLTLRDYEFEDNAPMGQSVLDAIQSTMTQLGGAPYSPGDLALEEGRARVESAKGRQALLIEEVLNDIPALLDDPTQPGEWSARVSGKQLENLSEEHWFGLDSTAEDRSFRGIVRSGLLRITPQEGGPPCWRKGDVATVVDQPAPSQALPSSSLLSPELSAFVSRLRRLNFLPGISDEALVAELARAGVEGEGQRWRTLLMDPRVESPIDTEPPEGFFAKRTEQVLALAGLKPSSLKTEGSGFSRNVLVNLAGKVFTIKLAPSAKSCNEIAEAQGLPPHFRSVSLPGVSRPFLAYLTRKECEALERAGLSVKTGEPT